VIVIVGLVILVAAGMAGVSQDRDDLISERDTARAYTVHDEQRNFTASTPGDDGTARNGSDRGLRPSLSERPGKR
jgi:hypothetical protein